MKHKFSVSTYLSYVIAMIRVLTYYSNNTVKLDYRYNENILRFLGKG